jgi:hypothetical protein
VPDRSATEGTKAGRGAGGVINPDIVENFGGRLGYQQTGFLFCSQGLCAETSLIAGRRRSRRPDSLLDSSLIVRTNKEHSDRFEGYQAKWALNPPSTYYAKKFG